MQVWTWVTVPASLCPSCEQGSCLTPLSLDFLACEQSWPPRRLSALDEVAQVR